MKKFSLIVALFLAILLLQNCSKDTVTATASTTQTLFATINDSTWTTNTYTAVINYDATSKSKIFSCFATGNNKKIVMSVTQNNTTNTPGFPVKSFLSDAAGTNNFSFLTTTNGGVNYVQHGIVGPGSGSLSVTGIDSVKKVITGIFYFTAVKNNLDSNGNIISTSVSQITSGAFNAMPYTFTQVAN